MSPTPLASLSPRRPASAIAPARPRTLAPKPNPKVGFVSLGCPKALVDSERILTRLRAEGYDTVGSHAAADVVIVNTCGFIDSAVTESLDAIGQAMTDNGRVIVTGCLGKKADVVRARFPDVLSISGPQDFASVMDAVHTAVPPVHEPFVDLLPPQGIKLTPRHYAYLKISEGCNQKCSFCIIPSMRGRLASRPVDEVLKEAERLARAGVKELLVISQDTGAYGSDVRYAPGTWRGREWAARITDLAQGLSELGTWVRMHYLYPYPHLDGLLPLMAEGKVLPYMDVPFQHASPRILKLMRRPAAAENTLARVKAWQQAVPGLAIRSTFIVGFPGETEAEFQQLLDFLEEGRLAHAGCFAYSPVEGAPANLLPDHIAPAVQEERRQRFMETQARISRARLAGMVGQTLDVLIDEATPGHATGRTYADAPEIDGTTQVRAAGLTVGQMVRVRITEAGSYDLAGVLA